jgi:hypothetical protein
MLAMRNDCRLSDRHGNRRRRRSLDLGRVSIAAKDKMATGAIFRRRRSLIKDRCGGARANGRQP